MALPIVFQNDDFVVFDKPAGTSCHGPSAEKTLVDYLQYDFPGASLMHRLDRETSGLIIAAKTPMATKAFAQLFEQRKIEKYYLALVDKKGRKKQGTIHGNMEKGRNGNWRLSEKGEAFSATQFFSFAAGHGVRCCIVRPLTGRTHQIRVALKANASPILGDQRYGGTASDRLYLHAFALRFDLMGKTYEFICWPDAKGMQWSDSLQSAVIDYGAEKPWELNWPNARTK